VTIITFLSGASNAGIV